MKDLAEKLWPSFQAETSEQIEAIELALLNVGETDVDVNALFRHFHTLKGGCAMMGFAAMQAVAHACEDLLDPVRRGEAEFSEALVDGLLQALDCLKGQMASVVRERCDPPPAPGLLARLEALAAPDRGKAAPSARRDGHVAPARETTLPATGADDSQTAGAGIPAVPGDADAGAAPAVDAAARDAAFGLLRVALPALAVATLVPGPLPTATMRQWQDIAGHARRGGIPAIAGLAEELALVAGAELRRRLLADLIERLQHAEASAGEDLGARGATLRLRPVLEADFRSAASALARIPAAADVEVAQAAEAALEPLLEQASLLGLAHTRKLLMLVRQVWRDIGRGKLGLAGALGDLLRMAAALPADLLGGLEEDAAYLGMCQQLHDRLRETVSALAQGEERRARLATRPEVRAIPADSLAMLDAAALERLEAALDSGAVPVEFEVDVESASDAGAAFIAWLQSNGTLLGSRTLQGGVDQEPRLVFLAALSLATAAIAPSLATLDPRPRLDWRVCGAGAAAAPAAAGEAQTSAAAATLRVESATVDAFVSRVGEMVMQRNVLAHAIGRDDIGARISGLHYLLGEAEQAQPLDAQAAGEVRELLQMLATQRAQLVEANARLQATLSRLQEEVLALRVVPIALVFNRLPRVVRDLGHSLGRQVRLEISGEDVRIDKGMVEVLVEPLLHLVRNALDHGVEAPAEREAAGKPAQAQLRIGARQQGATLLVTIADDGRGIDTARIRARAVAQGLIPASAALGERELMQLIFMPGLSTAERVTDVSGRGVGMDAVRTRVQQLGGQVEVASAPGEGTTFTLRLPVSAAIQSVILVAAGRARFALPERNVTEIVSVACAELQSLQGQACMLLRGVTLPVYRLAELLGRAGEAADGEALEVVVLGDGVHRIGLVVERVLGRPEVFVRDLHPDLLRLPGVGGATLLGDGGVVLILDAEKLFDLALRRAQGLRTLLRAS